MIRDLAWLPLLVGCASVAQAGATIDDAPETVDLRVRVAGERAVYRRSQTLSLMDDGRGAAARVETRARLEHRAFGEDEVLEHVTYLGLELLRDGEPSPPHPRLRGIERLVVRSRLDARGRPVEPPAAAGRPATSPDLHSAVLAAARILRVTFPDRPVAPGDRWVGAPIEWDSPPSHRVAVVVEPTWTLRDFDRDADGALVALIDWDAPFRVLPFAAMAGTTLEGAGRIAGTTRVRVDDGVVGRTELDLSVSVGPSGAAALVGLFRFEAKYTDVITPTRERVRQLISGVRPVSPPRRGPPVSPAWLRRVAREREARGEGAMIGAGAAEAGPGAEAD